MESELLRLGHSEREPIVGLPGELHRSQRPPGVHGSSLLELDVHLDRFQWTGAIEAAGGPRAEALNLGILILDSSFSAVE